MFLAIFRAGLIAGLIVVFCATPTVGTDEHAGSPEASLRVVRLLLSEGRAAEAGELLARIAESYPDQARSWEFQVLGEASRQAASPPPATAAERPREDGPRLRVAQVLLFEESTIEEVAVNLANLKEAGVDTVFLRVFHNHGDRPLFKGGPASDSGVYFRTDVAPVLADYLAEIVPVCRRLGLSIFAWMTTRRCEWLLSSRPDLAELQFDPETGKILPSRSLNIFHPKVQATLGQLFADLAAYDIDGILFQDDLVLRTGEGFSPEAITAYMEDGGATVSPEALFRIGGSPSRSPLFSPDNYRPAFWDWVGWKNRRLLGLAGELMESARRVRPQIRFALNLYYEAVLNPRMALAWYAQDLKAALDHPFDYFSVMSYHRQIGKELSLTGDEAIGVLSVIGRRAVSTVGKPERVIMKVQALDWNTSRILPGTELDRALAAATPVEEISLAFVRSLSDPPLDVIRKHFRGKER